MARFLKEAENHSTNLLTPGIRAVLADKTDLASQTVDEDDDEEDDSDDSELEDASDEEDTVSQ